MVSVLSSLSVHGFGKVRGGERADPAAAGDLRGGPVPGLQILKRVAAAVDSRLEGAVTFLLETPAIPGSAP